MPYHEITVAAANRARTAYEQNEPRDLFYKTATELIALSLAGRTNLTLSEAVAVLLQTWNREYYRFRKFDSQHFADIDALLASQRVPLSAVRSMNIRELGHGHGDEASATPTFIAFELVLGPVGAAKTLHLLAPQYFPIWDRAIASAYVGQLGRTGTNGERYWEMMGYAARQATHLVSEGYTGNPLKGIDEYNYCHFSKKWI